MRPGANTPWAFTNSDAMSGAVPPNKAWAKLYDIATDVYRDEVGKLSTRNVGRGAPANKKHTTQHSDPNDVKHRFLEPKEEKYDGRIPIAERAITRTPCPMQVAQTWAFPNNVNIGTLRNIRNRVPVSITCCAPQRSAATPNTGKNITVTCQQRDEAKHIGAARWKQRISAHQRHDGVHHTRIGHGRTQKGSFQCLQPYDQHVHPSAPTMTGQCMGTTT